MKIIIMAPKGKMGKLIVKAAAEDDSLEVFGVIGPKGRDYIGNDAGVVAGIGYNIGVPVTDNLKAIIDGCDGIIDFSTVELSMDVLEAARKHKKALVCGTTGFNDSQLQKFYDASKEIPLMLAANTSYVVSLMKYLISIAAKALDGKADIEILDMHDALKKDAPSGTAKEMAEAMAKARKMSSYDDLVKFHSIRAGDISSSHTVLFGCIGERLEITHHAYNWECFAKGACDAIKFINNKQNGSYVMEDMINNG
ncbi:MAG TPA: 4-hydroxy-tetrahydrodipicolinate reductase [Clostridiales bacterium]|nr:4-hydroxy-tetrahydrodipicolinate reductase [Clostridiales bacterium]